ncbi:nicotinate phosphoribosyltransferase family protein [Kipferlia bialata]|uniref:Nicotinate phosphoribosyltransferase family protein n=1 Tax=Kipferlia bialata TaxID=797122 RepID=A0A9K3CPI2_9EUKA|nr:nicotinate phosphoribosyltransferase family protein [Kipferlia bialata]|eukprot:g737.t1
MLSGRAKAASIFTDTQIPEPSSGFMGPMMTDLYQFTMCYAYWKLGVSEKTATFELFFRKNPFKGEFTVFAGMDEIVKFLHHFKIREDDIDYLKTVMPDAEDGFWQYLRDLDLSGVTLRGVKAGTPVFPKIPLITVTGPLGAVQLLETPLLNGVNYPSLLVTNAARMRYCLSSTLTNFTATWVVVYAALSVAPMLFPTLAQVQWDAIFHPRGWLRHSLFAVVLDLTACLSIGYWAVDDIDAQTDLWPKWAQRWSLVHNMAIHGSNVIWLLLDVCKFDRGLSGAYRRSTVIWTWVAGVVYTSLAMGSGVMTDVYPYFFFRPEHPQRKLFIVTTFVLGGVCHFAFMYIINRLARHNPIPEEDVTPHVAPETPGGLRVYGAVESAPVSIGDFSGYSEGDGYYDDVDDEEEYEESESGSELEEFNPDTPMAFLTPHTPETDTPLNRLKTTPTVSDGKGWGHTASRLWSRVQSALVPLDVKA